MCLRERINLRKYNSRFVFCSKMESNTDHEFKIILLGESGVGKTSLTHTYTAGRFNPNRKVTVVADLTRKELTLNGKRIKLCIWDTAGQERFKSLVPKYFRDVDGVLLVYDTTNSMTFNVLSSWLTQLKEQSDGAVAIVVGNKIDHPDSTAVSRDVAMRFARDEHLEFMESSAKNGDNVINIFEHLTLKILQAKNWVPNEEPNLVNCEALTSSTNTVTHENGEHELCNEQIQESNLEDLGPPLEPDIRITSNAASRETDDTLQNVQQTTPCSENGNSIISQTTDNIDVNDDMEQIEQTFIFVSYLPPIVKLPDDVPLLQVGRRRTSADSVLSLMTESERNSVRLRAETQTPKRNKSSC